MAGATGLAIAVWLWAAIGRSLALTFAACVAGLVLASAALKMIAGVFAPPYSPDHLLRLSPGAPSGHVALAGIVYGAPALVFLRRGQGAGRWIGAGVCAGAIAIVSLTRVTLHHHTVGDVTAGAALAAVAIAVFDRRLSAGEARPVLRTAPLLALIVFVAAVMLLSGARLPSTRFL